MNPVVNPPANFWFSAEEKPMLIIVQAVLVSVEIVDQRFSLGAAHNALQQSPPVCFCLLSPTGPVA